MSALPSTEVYAAPVVAGQLKRGLRADVLGAFFWIVLFFGAGGYLSSLIYISAAVYGGGQVGGEVDEQKVQYLEGGNVEKIVVRDGQAVKAGDILVQMDTSGLNAQFEIEKSRVIESYLQQARLQAQVVDDADVITPPALLRLVKPNETQTILAAQRSLLTVHRNSIRGQSEEIAQRIEQEQSNIQGLTAQQEANDAQLALVAAELESREKLQKSGNGTKSAVSEVKRELATLQASSAGLGAQIAQSSSAILGLRASASQLLEADKNIAMEQLQQARSATAESVQRFLKASEQLERASIRAPRDGVVHELSVNTPGQVIAPGGEIARVVPAEDAIVFEVQIAASDIDQVVVGQRAFVRLSALDPQRTPDVAAIVQFVSPTSVLDPMTRTHFYSVRLLPDEGALDRLREPIVQGMPVVAFIKRDDRSVLSFLLQPIRDRIEYAFRES